MPPDDTKNKNLMNDYGDGLYFMVSSAFRSSYIVRYIVHLFRDPYICAFNGHRQAPQRSRQNIDDAENRKCVGGTHKMSLVVEWNGGKKNIMLEKSETTHFCVFTHGVYIRWPRHHFATPSACAQGARWTKGNSLTFYEYIIMLFSNCNKTRCWQTSERTARGRTTHTLLRGKTVCTLSFEHPASTSYAPVGECMYVCGSLNGNRAPKATSKISLERRIVKLFINSCTHFWQLCSQRHCVASRLLHYGKIRTSFHDTLNFFYVFFPSPSAHTSTIRRMEICASMPIRLQKIADQQCCNGSIESTTEKFNWNFWTATNGQNHVNLWK